MEVVIITALLSLVALVGLGCFLLALAVVVKLVFPLVVKGESVPAGEEPRHTPDPMDEGFENIMGYSVMGKTGFGDGEDG